MTPQADTYDRILQAARDLIYARSYADVGVAAICEHARVKKGSFYHFFPSKQELTLAVLDTFFVDMKAGLLDQAFRPELPPLERLQQLGELTYEFQARMKDMTGHVLGCPFGNLASELATQDEAIRHKVSAIFEKFQSAIELTLQQARDAGDLPATDVAATAQAMLAYFEGAVLLAKTRNEPELLRQLLPAMTQIRIPAQH
ncbi:MAG: TetR family transcriptional regulator [Gammaproteobacteria bacterium]|nr:TetR family transcriptional regulator [Gammaproteobacteria bacterium]